MIFTLFVFRDEINIIRKKSAILSGVAALEYTAVPMATLVSVITLVFTGQPLTPFNVFMLLCFINVLRLSTCVYFAYAFLEAYEAYVSLGRIEDFLILKNLPAISRDQGEDDTSNTESSSTESSLSNYQEKMDEASIADEGKDLDKSTTLRVSSLTLKQIMREDEFILQDIEFVSVSQSLTVITGPVGSGKSTLLSTIAGQVADISGTITCRGTLAYVPQTPWVFSGTIRENILFGQSYDEPKYTRIIEACALTEDLQQFPDCDQTVVGERGEVLSGGQQARVSLARAVYADADLYLLDDPLSAVDIKVGKHIFEKCIKDLLGDKTRVLTSHQEQHMKEADKVIVLYKGRVLEKGSFTELQEKGVFNTTVDPLFKTVLKDNKSNKSLVSEMKERSDRMVPLRGEVKGLEISQEDRTIGMVTSALYWNYFRSGIHWLVIFAVICLCLITQGKPQLI